MRPRPALQGALALGLLALALFAAGGRPAAAAGCPNEDRRSEQGATELPDCRAFELVTRGALVGGDRIARAAGQGGALTYYTSRPAPGAATSAFFYLARRGADGWSYRSIGPQNASAALFGPVCEQNAFFSPDLSRYVLEAGWYEAGEPAHCKRPEEPIVAGEPSPYRNVFLYDPVGAAPQLLNAAPAGTAAANAGLQDASDDFGHVVFAEGAQLTPEAPPGLDYYVWHDGTVRLLTVLPDGSAAAGELVEATGHGLDATFVPSSGFAPLTGALSDDGRRALFYSGDGLYLRENPGRPQSPIVAGLCTDPALACTRQVDSSQGPGADGGGVFWRATPDGGTVFFSDDRRLTPDSTAASGAADLYRYDAESGLLSDLTANAGEAADVRGVVGMAEDGSYLYFVANGSLAAGAEPGDCRGSLAAPGHCSLYLLRGGEIAFVARLSGSESAVWQETLGDADLRRKAPVLWANVSPNGEHLAFLSTQSLTGYDNENPGTGAPDRQLFLYDAAAAGAGTLRCLSCPPGPSQDPFVGIAAAGNYGSLPELRASWMRHAVLDDGTVFFTTSNPLLAADSDGEEDVYEWGDGALHLLSPGGTGRSRFLDASPDGADVFFTTAASLVGEDLDNEHPSLYDARAGGGFPAPPPAPPGCEGDACRAGSAPAPVPPVPATGWTRPKPRKPKPCHRHRRQQARERHDRHAAGHADRQRRRCGRKGAR